MERRVPRGEEDFKLVSEAVHTQVLKKGTRTVQTLYIGKFVQYNLLLPKSMMKYS